MQCSSAMGSPRRYQYHAVEFGTQQSHRSHNSSRLPDHGLLKPDLKAPWLPRYSLHICLLFRGQNDSLLSAGAALFLAPGSIQMSRLAAALAVR
jgi:hypothetical protein